VSTVHQASAARHCYTPDAADGAVRSCVPQAHWRAVRCESGGHLLILLHCPRPRSNAPSQVSPLQASAVCNAQLRSHSGVTIGRASLGVKRHRPRIAGANRFPISVCRTYLVCGLPSPGWAWHGRVRCRNGTMPPYCIAA
jgi:hypothetical protein